MKVGIIPKILVLLAMAPALCSATIIDFYTDGAIENGDVYDVVNVWEVSLVEMTGGIAYELNQYNSSVFDMYDGGLQFVQLSDSSTMNLYGGEVGYGGIRLSGSSILNVYGGAITYSVLAGESSHINIYGYDFELNGKFLSGYWSDGTRFEDIYFRTPDTYTRVTLHEIPEPATLCLLAFAGVLLRNRRK